MGTESSVVQSSHRDALAISSHAHYVHLAHPVVWYIWISLQLVMVEVDFLLTSESQVLAATSVVWGRQPRANVNRVQRKRGWVGGGDREKWFRTIIGVYTWRRSQKAVDTAQTLMWMCIHWKSRRKHTQKLNELCQHPSHVTSYCHTNLTFLYSLIWLEYLCLLRNVKQVWWMKYQYCFASSVFRENLT